MPDALPLTGLFGKVPAHGDFVRRGLPTTFVGPWDAWLQDGMATARERLGDRWAALWDSAPPWRFALPAGACGPDAVAGVLLPSEDMVGRRFPITLAALLAPDAPLPADGWFTALEAAALAGRAGRADADALASAIPAPDAAVTAPMPLIAPAAWPLAEPADPPPVDAPHSDPLGVFADNAASGPAQPPLDGMDPPDLAATVEPTPPSTEVAGGDDLLDVFSGPARAPRQEATMAAIPSMATPPAPEPTSSDGTLAFLLGEAGASAAVEPWAIDPPDAPFAQLPGGSFEPAGDDADPLAALIAAGDASMGGTSPPAQAETVSATRDAMPIASAAEAWRPADAPTPPVGGGWWTAGGGALPPSIRPWPTLLPAADFASFLEADA
jgi:type VI secretion system protein ImpM